MCKHRCENKEQKTRPHVAECNNMESMKLLRVVIRLARVVCLHQRFSDTFALRKLEEKHPHVAPSLIMLEELKLELYNCTHD